MNPPKPESHPKAKRRAPYKKILIIFAAMLVVLILGLGIYYALWLNSLGFEAYKPGVLPGGIVVTKHAIVIAKQTGGPDGAYFKTISYELGSSDISIGEQKSSAADYASRLFSCKEPLLGSTCLTYTSPKHQMYSIQTAFDVGTAGAPGKAFDQTISWLRGDTLIWVSLQQGQAGKYDPESWGKAIDSFAPASYGFEFTKIQ